MKAKKKLKKKPSSLLSDKLPLMIDIVITIIEIGQIKSKI